MKLITNVSTIKESGTDGNGNYWSASYSRSHNNDIMDNFRMEFWKKDKPDANCMMANVTVKFGTKTNMFDIMQTPDLINISSDYEHLVGKALSSLQRIIDASKSLV